MLKPRRSVASYLWPVTLSLWLAVPAVAQTQALKASSLDGELILVSAPHKESYLTRADGSRFTLPLPAAAHVGSFAATDTSWFAAAVDNAPGGRRLVVLKGVGERAKELAPLSVVAAAELREPMLLVDDRLRGLAWIEGEAPRRQVVRAASWGVGGWGKTVTVSPRGPGSQMALAAARLDDGTWLLAWAAFDGEDDEIMWSRWDGRSATEPARLAADNEVPDLTPHLWATGGGALAAWSRFDGGDYRVHLARFDGASWSRPEIAGPPGSVYPTFHRGAEGPVMMYLNAMPRAWMVAELGAGGEVLRLSGVETDHAERPLLASAGPESVSLMWIGEDGAPEIAPALAWADATPARE